MINRIDKNLDPVTAEEKAAHKIVKILKDREFDAYIVGGAVRDRLLDLDPKEVDVTTNATPESVQEVFPRTYAVGAKFGVIVVLIDEVQIEVATFREDRDYTDGRHPDTVVFSDAEHDANRRDLTINALLYDPIERVIIDYVEGLRDLDHGCIRAIGDPDVRFREDYLRTLRAIRFAARFGFTLDNSTRLAIERNAPEVNKVSAERIFEELTKILTGPAPDIAFRLLDTCGLLREVLPEIQRMKGVQQPAEFHPEGDVWEHTLLVLKTMDHPNPKLAWSALLHDVGKPPTFCINDRGRESFPLHAKIGAELSVEILRRFKCSREHIEAVRDAVYYHMSFAEVKKMRRSTLRRLLARETFEMELELHRIDCLSCHEKLGNYDFLIKTREEFDNEPPIPAPLLTGRDLLERGIPEGRRIGLVLKDALELQLNDDLTSRDAALRWLDDQLAKEE